MTANAEGLPSPPALPPGWPRRGLIDRVLNVVTGPKVQRPLSAVLRRLAPVARLGKRVIVTRHADVVDVLRRDTDFTVAELNAPSMEKWSGAFILGFDRGERYAREAAVLRRAARREDLERVRHLVRDSASQLIATARPTGRLEVVHGLARVAAARTVAGYFGVPGPDEATLMRWMRAMFDSVFIDSRARARKTVQLTVAEFQPYMEQLIRSRRAALEAGEPVPDNVLTRLIVMGADEPWLDDDAVRRNINGIIVGAVDTTSKSVTFVIDELLRRPDALAAARQAALAGDMETVRAYSWEALRFLPHAPFLQRTSHGAPIGKHKVKPNKLVLVGVLSAMFDGDAFPKPTTFRADRHESLYLHFGHGMHTCFGEAINRIQIPELVAAVLVIPGVRRAPGQLGKLQMDGPFPNRLVVEFEPSS